MCGCGCMCVLNFIHYINIIIIISCMFKVNSESQCWIDGLHFKIYTCYLYGKANRNQNRNTDESKGQNTIRVKTIYLTAKMMNEKCLEN